MGHLFDAGEQQCSTQRGRPFAWAALAPKKRGVLAPPVASVTPVSSALAGRRLRGTPAPYRIAAPMLDRRRFLKLAGLTALAAAAPRTGEPTEHAGLLHLTATEAVRHISEGSLSAETYARALLAQAERLSFLDTIISIDPEAVLEAARLVDVSRRRGRTLGPLAGLPLLVKDNIDTKALPTTAGTPGLLANRPRADAPLLDPLFGAGALLFANANMHELAFGITSHNYHFGAVRNPYDSTLIPGGSSGGTGAGIAARVCPAGLGTDTGGSVRIPAALCGVVGLRPTKGRYSIAGIVPISHTRDTPGPMGRTVADVALLDAVETLTTPARPARLRGLRLGVPRNPFWQDLDPEVAAVMEDALHRLRALGVVLVEVDVPGVVTLDQQAGFPIALFEANLDIPAYLAAEGNGITFDDIQRQIASPDVAGAIAVGLAVGHGAGWPDGQRSSAPQRRARARSVRLSPASGPEAGYRGGQLDGHSARPHHRPLPRSSRGGEAPGRSARRVLGGVTPRLRARIRQREPDPRLRPAGAVREPSHLLPRRRRRLRGDLAADPRRGDHVPEP